MTQVSRRLDKPRCVGSSPTLAPDPRKASDRRSRKGSRHSQTRHDSEGIRMSHAIGAGPGKMVRRMNLGIFVVIALTLAGLPLNSSQADTTYGANNTRQRIYLSPAYHTADAGARGECQWPNGTNRSERGMARGLADETATLVNKKYVGDAIFITDVNNSGLVANDFIVRVGDGDPVEASTRSNNWNASAHIPLHSNAGLPAGCANTSDNRPVAGTRQIYRSGDGNDLPTRMANQLEAVTPGTGDRICTIANCTNVSCLQELCAIDAFRASYSETEFHDWNEGVDFLTQERETAAIRITRAVDNVYS